MLIKIKKQLPNLRKTAGILFALCFLMFGLTLVPACRRNDSSQAAVTAVKYHCPMHPNYISDKPGDCPICHMRLVPLEDSSGSSAGNPQTAGVSGQAAVNLNSAREQMIGVKTSPVEHRELYQLVRASARVAYDPALYSAILEHQQAVKTLGKIPDSADVEYRQEARSTVRASRMRLRQMGLPDDQIERMGASDQPPSNLLLGTPGGTVWVYAELYDYEAGQVRQGQEVELTTPAFPGHTFHGKVRSVDSNLNSDTRTLKARIEAPNPGGHLKPEMYLTAIIHAALGKHLAVPETAVMDTGTRQLVFVQKAPGQFEPREIRVGREADGFFEVREGLKEGEQVVTSANFLIDSESKIKAAVGGNK